MRIAFAGVFAGHVADRVRARLRIPCEVTLTDDRGDIGDVDVLYVAGIQHGALDEPGRARLRVDRKALAALPSGATTRTLRTAPMLLAR